MIRIKNMVCGYGRKKILSDVNLEIEPGKLTCLLGKNGVGKTTLFKTILGFLPPLEGEILLGDKPLKKHSPKELAKMISYVPQAHGTPFPFSVFDVVLMGQFAYSGNLLSMPGKKNRDIAMECIQTLGIEKMKDKAFSKLSGGEKQMVLIARAMAQQPRFIAMDEPTSNLDLGNQVKVMQVAQLLRDKGYGVIMNTHNPDQALNYADCAVLLKDGKIKCSGHPDKIMVADQISEIYSTRVELFTTSTEDGSKRRVCVAL